MTQEREKSNCKKVLEEIFPNVEPRLIYAGGGILVEMVHSKVVSGRLAELHLEVFNKMFEFNAKSKKEDRFAIHKLYMYSEDKKKYQIRAFLHTQRSNVINGMPSSFLSIEDAIVWISELDSQSFAFGIGLPFELIALADIPNDEPFSLVVKDGKYKEVEFEGRHLPLKSIQYASGQYFKLIVGL